MNCLEDTNSSGAHSPVCSVSNPVERSLNHSVYDRLEHKTFGPLTQSEAESLQREANEDTTRSEDLRLFLKEMREKVKEDQEQHQRQQQLPSFPVLNMGHPASLIGHAGTAEFETSVKQHIRRPSVPANPIVNQSVMHEHRVSLMDFPNADTPPDGGWGWIVVLSSFCCMVLVDGVCVSYGLLLNPRCGYSTLKVIATSTVGDSRSFGFTKPVQSVRERILKPALGSCIAVSELGEAIGTQDRALLLTPGALLLGVYLLLGPLISALTNQFDFRPVAMVGAAVSTVAMFASSFANSIESLIASLGILGGVGFALIYLPAIATVGHWFQKRRPLAVGLALCGSGVGCLLGSQVVPRLVDWFTWRGAIVIMAAASFQCTSLIVLFRPMEVHSRICEVKRARQAAQDYLRRAAAARRAATERLVLEARQCKRMAIAKAAAERAVALQLQQQQLLEARKFGNTNLARGPLSSEIRWSDKKLQVNASFPLGARGRSNMLLTRTTRGGRVFTVQPPTHTLPPPEQIRPNPTAGGWLRNRTHSGRVSQTKRTPSRRLATYRGSIMQKIIEEKRRQRTVSIGSLDGMVITRNNELIAASLAPNCDRPLLSSSAIQRISEAVALKIEMKILQQQKQHPSSLEDAEYFIGAVQQGTLDSRAFSRSHLRVSLPQVVQEYIQSQLSLTYQQHRQSLFQIGETQVASTFPTPPPLVSPATHMFSNPNVELVSVHRDCTAVHNAVGVGPSTLGTGDTAQSCGHSTQSNNAPYRSYCDSAQTGPLSDQQQAHVTTNPRLSNPNPSNCPSESISLRRNASNVSLESRFQGGGASILTGATSVTGRLDGAELLDNEIKAEIHARLRRELSRPQYKKDLFFTGSVAHIGSSLLPSVLPSSPSLDPVLPPINQEKHLICAAPSCTGPLNTMIKVFSLRSSMQMAQQLNDHSGQDHPNSQTNLSLATSVCAAGNTFIPPAPCPTVQPPVVMYLPVHTSPPPTETTDNLNARQQFQGSVYTGVALVDAPSLCINNLPSADVHSSNMDSAITAYKRAASADPVTGEDDRVDGGVRDRNDALGIVDDDLNVGDGDDEVELEIGTRPVCGCYSTTTLPFWCVSCTSSLMDVLTPMRSFIHELLSPWILLSPAFAFMLLSSTVSMMGLFVPYLLLPDLLAELNWQLTDSGFIISAIAVGNTVGRLIVTMYIDRGWSSVYRWADCLWLNNFSLFVTSVTVALMPIVRIYYSALVLACVIFGFFSAVFVSLKSILVVELLGLDRLTNSFGYMLLMQGIAVAIGTPFAGYLRDVNLSRHSHDMLALHVCPVHHAASVGFYFSASCLLLACLLACPLRRLSRKESPTLVFETHNAYAANPLFEFGPGHTALDAHIPPQTGDIDFHSGLLETNGVTNCTANLSDTMPANAGDFPHEQIMTMAFTSNQNSDHQSGMTIQPAPMLASQTTTTMPTPSGSVGPGLLDVGPPCILATIDENLSVVGTSVGTLDTDDLITPVVLTVQEEPGLEPVAEEEEEYEEEEITPDSVVRAECALREQPHSHMNAQTGSTVTSAEAYYLNSVENTAIGGPITAKKLKLRKRKIDTLPDHHPPSELYLPSASPMNPGSELTNIFKATTDESPTAEQY